ncbi:M20/M25/M40 family metallo-hydrolase [Agromyces protaetiae]|uniref:M20/M25/M40 family metallo-hydrolase n=1 Tax=Agromyces protaetiae TaxID=2509455 RepID=A0A4P6FHT8_9MICO|nr:M20/M25/M40 family metallo-hydrolase [Agromyces protaetiae]QAY73497.1 M20/M25/M40 family metallo-hydrolase [Agromyces protaetiae]
MADAAPPLVDRVATTDVAALCARLIRFDTSNFGADRSNGERECAEFIAGELRRAGYEPLMIGPSPARQSVVLRVPGRDRSLPGLLVHGHIDVVPAEASDWSVPPFEGRIADGYIWGRGAIDMKDMVAMMLAVLLDWAETGDGPERDVVFLFVADEEDRGEHGALWLAAEHPELLAGVEAAIGESGGGPTPVLAPDGRTVRLYPIATGERGTMHLRVRAHGRAGHGSRPTSEHAVQRLIDALHRVGTHRWPLHVSASVGAFLSRANAAIGLDADLSTETGVEAAIAALGDAGETARYTVRGSSTPTMLSAGYKVNVIPQTASAEIDVRCPPGYDDEMLATITTLLGDEVEFEFSSFQSPIEAPIDSAWFESMRAAVVRADPEAVVVPFCMGGGTDAKAFAPLGIACYGFAPLGPDPDGRVPAGAHGIDERVPVASLEAGRRMLRDFLEQV